MKVSLMLSCVIGLAVSSALAQSTTFTYQGELKQGNTLASGTFDMGFRLFDGATDIGYNCIDNVLVTDGKFAVRLDYANLISTNSPKTLEVDVRADTSTPCTDPAGYTVLWPRQTITPTPLAIHANTSASANIAQHAFTASLAAAANSLQPQDGSPVNAVFVDNAGNIGIGTTTPGIDVAPSVKLEVAGGSISAGNSGDQADLLWLNSERNWVFRQQGAGAGAALKLQNVGGGGNKNLLIETTGLVGIGTLNPTHTLHIANASPTLAIQDTDSNGAPLGQQVGYVSYRDSGNVERAWVGYGSAGDPDFSIVNARQTGDIVLNPFSGNVGIGTASPAAKLEVRGDIRVGTTGQFFAASGDQNLRILRGGISTAGTPFFGTGWTSSRISAGWYSVDYNTNFGDAPTVVAMAASSANVFVSLTNDNGGGFDLQVRNSSGTLVDAALRFIAVGVR